VDRLLGNQQIDPWHLFPAWVAKMTLGSKKIIVAMDWTDFDADGQSTLMLSLVLKEGKSIPLIWRTHGSSPRASFSST
jgi:hypothetical protein